MNRRYGLTTEEANARYRECGANEIVPSHMKSRFAEARKILLDPMGLMLLALAAIYGMIGDRTDSMVLLIAYVPVTVIDVILELRASRALRALKATLQLTAKVYRDGEIREIPIRQVVPDDIILFDEGQTLPADGKVVEAHALSINESALTGESIPIEKDESAEFYAGTTVLQGRGLGRVEKTGASTRFGRIAELLEETVEQQSPLQRKVNRLIRWVIAMAAVLVLVLFFIEFMRGMPFLQSLIVALTFGMAAIPEEFPLVFTLYLSVGAWRLSKHGVLVKSLPSVETLGSVDVICTDKTGTLTEGKFQLEELRPFKGAGATERTSADLWQTALMACEENPTDAMEAEVFRLGERARTTLKGWTLKWDYAFDAIGKHMAHVWVHSETGTTRIAMKGAVEGVLDHCAIDSDARRRVHDEVNAIAGQGKRILALASREGPSTGNRETDESGLTLLGLLIYSDPIRAEVKDAINACQRAGIEIKMLTGDHPLTAHAIADQAGIIHSHQHLYTGSDLAKLDAENRRVAYLKGAVFSRVLPEEKHEMVQALKASGKIVAMTGDGINDAPALKLADIGISMGASATDVARSAAQMVLLKNDINGIVHAVFEGRKIFSNLRRSFSYLIAFHVPIIVLALLPPMLGFGDLLLPIHIVLLELIVHPVSAFAFENLPREPSRGERNLLSAKRFGGALASGLILSLGALWIAHHAFQAHAGEDSMRSLALASVLFGNLFFVLAESLPAFTRRMLATVFSLGAVVVLVFATGALRRFFHLTVLTELDFAVALGIGLVAALPMLVSRVKS